MLEEERKKIIERQAKKRMKAGKKTDPALILGQGSQDDTSGRTDRQIAEHSGISHNTISKFNYISKNANDDDETIRMMCEGYLDANIWIVEHQLKHRRNLSDVDRIKIAMALKDELEDKASKNSAKDNWYTNENKKPSENECSVLNTRTGETDKESQGRRNKNRVNTQLADLAGVSSDKVFRYKEILEHGTPEEIAVVGVLYSCNST